MRGSRTPNQRPAEMSEAPAARPAPPDGGADERLDAAIEMLERLVGFDTESSKSNLALVACVALGLLLGADPVPDADAAPPDRLARAACRLFLVVAAANVVSFLLECGLGPCPDDPVGYLWLPGTR